MSDDYSQSVKDQILFLELKEKEALNMIRNKMFDLDIVKLCHHYMVEQIKALKQKES